MWSHDRAAWTVEAKFIVNDYGLRNRLAIITETPGQPTFERRIYAQYAYMAALLDYTNAHAKEIQARRQGGRRRDGGRVVAGAESGQLKNFLDGEYRSRGKIDLLAYRTNVAEYRPGTSLLGTRPGTADGQPEVVPNVDDLTMPVGTREATVPRAYVFPAAMTDVAATLRAHNVRIRTLEKPMRLEGEQFMIKGMRKVRSSGYDMTVLDGAFSELRVVEFPAGSLLRGHGAADGQRRVLLPRASGTGWIRRLGPAGRDVARARCGRARRDLPDLQGPARSGTDP